MEIEFHAIYNQKKATPTVLISDKTDFKAKGIPREIKIKKATAE